MSKLEATSSFRRSKSVMKIAEGKQEARILTKQQQQLQLPVQTQTRRQEQQQQQKQYLNHIDSSRMGPKQASGPAKKPNESDESSVVFCSPMHSEPCESPQNESYDYDYRNNNNTTNNNNQTLFENHKEYLHSEDHEILKASSVMEFNARDLRISTSESQCEAKVRAALNEWQQIEKAREQSESAGGKNITQVQKGVEELERQFGECLQLADKMESKYKSIQFLMKGTTVQKVSRTSRKKKWQDRVVLYSAQTNSICWRKCSDMHPQKRQGIPLSTVLAVCVTPAAQGNNSFPVNKGVVCSADQYLRIAAEVPFKDLELVCKDKEMRDRLVNAMNVLIQDMKESRRNGGGDGQMAMTHKETRAVSRDNQKNLECGGGDQRENSNSSTSVAIFEQKKYFQAEINALMVQLEDTKGVFEEEINRIQAAVREGAAQFLKQERSKERAKRYAITAKAQSIISTVMQDLQQKQQLQSGGVVSQSSAISTSNNITVNEGNAATKNYHWIKQQQQQLTESEQQQQYQQQEQAYQQQQLYEQIYLEQQGQLLDECDISSENNHMGVSNEWREQQQQQLQQQMARSLRECISKLSIFPCCKEIQKQQSSALMQQQQQQDVFEMVGCVSQAIDELSAWSNQQQCSVRQFETRHTQLLREYNELLEEKRCREEKIQAETKNYAEEIAQAKRINEELKGKLTEFQQKLGKKQEEFKEATAKLTEMKDALVGQIASLQGQNNQLQLTINTNSQNHMLKVSYLTKQLGEKEEKIKELENKIWKLEKEVEGEGEEERKVGEHQKQRNCMMKQQKQHQEEDTCSGIDREDADESETQRTNHTRYTSQTQLTTYSNNKQQYSQNKVKNSDKKDNISSQQPYSNNDHPYPSSSVGLISAHLTPKRFGSPYNSPHRNILDNTYHHNSYMANNLQHNTSSNNSNSKSLHNQSESCLKSNQKETASKQTHKHNFSINKNTTADGNDKNSIIPRNNYVVGETNSKAITAYDDYTTQKTTTNIKPITPVLSNDSLLKHDSDRVAPYAMSSNVKRLTSGSFREACNVSETSKGSFNERFGDGCRVGSNEKERKMQNSLSRKENSQFFQDTSSGRNYLKGQYTQNQHQNSFNNNNTNELQYSFKAVSAWNADSHTKQQQQQQHGQDKENMHPNIISPKHTRNLTERQFPVSTCVDVIGNGHNRSYKSNVSSYLKGEQIGQDDEGNTKKTMMRGFAVMEEESMNRKLGSPSPQTEVRYPFAATSALRPAQTLGNLRQQQVNTSSSSNNLLKNKANLTHHRIESYQDFDRRMAKQFSKVVQQK